MAEKGINDIFGCFDGECCGCDDFTRLNDISLCQECAGKLERDLIRERDWDYSFTAFGLSDSKREELRKQVVGQYGEKLELIAPKESKKNRITPKKRKRSGKS